MRFRRFAAGGLAVAVTLLAPAIPASAAEPTVDGTGCGVNEGVTVVVDFVPNSDEVEVGCASGPQDTIGAAMIAAGFTITTELTGFGNYLCAINGVAANPTNCQAFPGPYWSGWLNTAGGAPGGAQGTDWVSAVVGVDGGPLAVGTVAGFTLNTDGSFPGATPRLDLTELPPPDNGGVAVPPYGAGTGSAAAVAGWIGRQLAASGGLLNGNPGSTVDAIYALAAAGVGGDQIASSAAAVQASGSAYIGTPAESATKFAAVSKVAFALQIAGLDPTQYPDGAGTRDLLAEVRSVLQPDGHFGSYDDPFLHAYALIALSRTVSGAPETAINWLQSQQCTDGAAAGAYGFEVCTGADPDYTALAIEGLLAAGVDPADPSVADAVSWLAAQQTSDGDLAGNTNSTGLGGQVFAAVGAGSNASLTAGFIGGLQITCGSVLADGSALVDDNVGAIAWKPASLADATQFGIDDGNLGEWQYSSVQAVFGLGAPALGELTAAGADPALPAATVCAPPTTDSSTPPTETSSSSAAPTSTSTSTSTAVVTTSKTSAAPMLSSTGVSDRTLPEVLIAVLLVALGSGVLMLSRRRVGGRHR